MVMLFQMSNALLALLAMASARDTGKFMKTVPTISNSLVNLGKMEISFYFNGKHPDMLPKPEHMTRSEFFPQIPFLEQTCPCSDFKPGPSFLSDPSEIVSKILKSNDLFKDRTSSFCCGSHEHVQESTVFFELGPNAPRNMNTIQLPPNQNIQRSPLPIPPFVFNKGPKPKALEIILFPKRKDINTFDFTNFFTPKKRDFVNKTKSQEREKAGEKESSPKQPSASVKKDLTYMEKKNLQELTTDIPEGELNTDLPPVTNVNNAL